MNKTASFLGLAIFFFVGSMALVFSGQRFMESWNRDLRSLEAGQERLRRQEGWLLVQDEVKKWHDQAWGNSSGLSGQRAYWFGLEGFQQMAQSQGLAVTEIRPAILQAGSKQEPLYRLDAKVTGPMDNMALLLKQLPERIPGVQLESVQFSPLEEGQIQGLIRLMLRGDPSVAG